jgi:hypothetical protein
MRPIILSLFDRTGNAVRPWAEAGWECWTVDIQHPEGYSENRGGIVRVGVDLRTWRPPADVRPCFVSAFPPCTHLAGSGGAHFKKKGIRSVIEALELVEACVEICLSHTAPFYIENPVGILATHWRKWDCTFDPCDYAGYLRHPGEDAYTKKTCLWVGNGFRMPPKKRVGVVEKKNRIHYGTSLFGGVSRADTRSQTPLGFAKAVFLANRTIAV